MKRKLKLFLSMITCFIFAFIINSCKNNSEIVPLSITVNGQINESYSLNDVIDYSFFTIDVTFSDDSIKTYTIYDEEVSVEGGSTSEIGSHSLIIKCLGFEKVFNYTVSNYQIHLIFNEGTFDGKEKLDIEVTDSTFDILNYTPTSNDPLYQFAGWFYDKELTNRIDEEINGYVKIDGNTTLYAGYDYNYDDLFKYTIANNEVTLDSLEFAFAMGETTLTIPSTIKLYPVTKIGHDFTDIDQLGMSSFLTFNDLVFEENSYVKEIEARAFEHVRFTNISLPESLETIGEYAFSNTAATALYIPKNVIRIKEGAFSYNLFTSISFQENSKLIYIGKEAFYLCQKISNIVFPDELETIATKAFSSCVSLESVTISKSVSNIGLQAFENAPMLKEFIVDDDNEVYCSIDGNLYSKNKDIFYRYCFGKQDKIFTLPATVKTIYESAFDVTNEVCNLTQINLNSSLTYIGGEAFKNCTADFTLPSSLNNIATNAFLKCNISEFKLDSNNQTFSVVDGLLLSKDKRELYAVPYLYNEELTIPNSVEIIKSGALVYLDNVKFIHILKDSNLKEVNEFGFVPFAMKSLIAIYIDKETPFDLVNNSCYYSQTLNYTDFSIILSNDASYLLYKNKWDSYKNSNEDNELLLIQNYLKSIEEYCDDVIYNISFYNYTSYDRYLNGYPAFLNVKFAEKKHALLDTLSKIEVLYQFDKSRYSAYYDYITDFIMQTFKNAFDYYNNITDDLGLLRVQADFNKFVLCYNSLPNSISSMFSTTDIEKMNSTITQYKAINEKQTELINDIMNFEVSNDKFDVNKATEIINRYNELGSVYIKMSNIQLNKYYAIECSKMIYDFINLEKTKDNYLKLKNLYCKNDVTYTLGIEGYLASYFQTESSKKNLYMYDSLYQYKQELDNLEDSMINEIEQFYATLDKSAAYDEEQYTLYISMYQSLDTFSYNLSYETIANYQFIYARKLMNDFINTNIDEVTYDNFNEVYKIYAYVYNYAIYDFDLLTASEYPIFESKSAEFDIKFNELTMPYCLALQSVDFNSINDETISTLTNLKNQLGALGDILLYTNEDGDYISALDVYNAAYATNLIKKFCNEFLSDGSIEITENNYILINKAIYGDEINDGIDDFLTNNYTETFEYYLELFTQNGDVNYLQLYRSCLNFYF